MDAFSTATSTSQQLDMASMSAMQGKVRALTDTFQSKENKTELMKTAKQFEGVFFNQMLNEMDKTVDRSNDVFGASSGQDMFRGMLNEKIADAMANRPGGSGLGLAQAVYKQLAARLPEKSNQQGASQQQVDVTSDRSEVK